MLLSWTLWQGNLFEDPLGGPRPQKETQFRQDPLIGEGGWSKKVEPFTFLILFKFSSFVCVITETLLPQSESSVHACAQVLIKVHRVPNRYIQLYLFCGNNQHLLARGRYKYRYNPSWLLGRPCCSRVFVHNFRLMHNNKQIATWEKLMSELQPTKSKGLGFIRHVAPKMLLCLLFLVSKLGLKNQKMFVVALSSSAAMSSNLRILNFPLI